MTEGRWIGDHVLGGEAASIAALQFWVACVRREHHGYKFNSYPELFAALDDAHAAAQEKDDTLFMRKAKRAHRLFRADEHAHWPRLDIRWVGADRFSLLFCPAWYFVKTYVYPGQVFLFMRVRTAPTWSCEVVWSSLHTSAGPFPAFQTLTDRPELGWSAGGGRKLNIITALPTLVVPYNMPADAWPC